MKPKNGGDAERVANIVTGLVGERYLTLYDRNPVFRDELRQLAERLLLWVDGIAVYAIKAHTEGLMDGTIPEQPPPNGEE
jgi:hypothetical protein